VTTEAELLLERALLLSDDDRAYVASCLLDSLDPAAGEPEPGYDEAWATEIKRRLDDIDSGRVKMIPWVEVQKELYERLNRARP
jgi:putative addiction module component (TIGR02574 family)